MLQRVQLTPPLTTGNQGHRTHSDVVEQKTEADSVGRVKQESNKGA